MGAVWHRPGPHYSQWVACSGERQREVSLGAMSGLSMPLTGAADGGGALGGPT